MFVSRPSPPGPSPLSPGDAAHAASSDVNEGDAGDDSDDAASVDSNPDAAAEVVDEAVEDEDVPQTVEVGGWTRDDAPNVSQRAVDLKGEEREYTPSLKGFHADIESCASLVVRVSPRDRAVAM